MKTNENRPNTEIKSAEAPALLRQVSIATGVALLASLAATQGSTDYGPAIWRPACSGNWYTSGYGKKFYVEHDIEGYYWSCIYYFQGCSVQTSVHYTINGKKDNSSDANPGEVTQMVSDAYYAWHARCWNQHSMGTEHEGFVSNPAWFTPELYTASASLTKNKAEKYGFAKDRNHIIGHNEDSSSAWVSYANSNLGIDARCNTHTDPGPYWDWSGYMAKINPTAVNNASVVSISYPGSVSAGQSFSASITMRNSGTKVWSSDATPHNLGSQNPQDNSRWGTGRVGLPGGTPVNPGQNVTFTGNFTAPSTPGTYAFDWRMVEDGVQWFGATATGLITVTAPQIIVDNSSAGFSFAGTAWTIGTSSTDKYGADYRFRGTGAISDPATWTASINAGGHSVYAWWTQGPNRLSSASYIVYHGATSTTVAKNQQASGGTWNLLGTWSDFASGNNDVKLSCWGATGYVVIADAVKWQ